MSLFPDSLIRSRLSPFGIAPSGALCAQIRTYAELLLRWNSRVNLTAITDPAEILDRHFGESMFAASALEISRGALGDLGSGAGFPGLALKIISPELRVTLIESNNKKATFLAEVQRALELENVEILRARIDEAPQVKFDFITARAFGNFSEILPWAHPRLSNPEFPNSSGAPGKIVLWLGSADSKSVQKSPSWSWQPEIPIPRSKNSLILPGTPI